jgi:hypothetical protein
LIRKIVSGGQTGADRAALDVALSAGVECGGWVPKGRLAEDGPIAATYPNLVEADSAEPRVRTELNVRDSDATVVLTHGVPTGGSAVTLEAATRLGKPALHLDLDVTSPPLASRRLAEWLDEVNPQTLNVAGSRNSKDPRIYELTRAILSAALRTSVCCRAP